MILRPSCSCCLPTTATNRRRTTSTGSCRVPFRSRRSTKSSVSAVGCEPSSVEHTLRCDTSGERVVHGVADGFHGCVFAYGQTGSGKSHTIFGGADEMRGLLPRICENLFRCLQEENSEYIVKLSYLEIYNEKLRDLLRPTKASEADLPVLEIRQHPKVGCWPTCFVYGCGWHSVHDDLSLSLLALYPFSFSLVVCFIVAVLASLMHPSCTVTLWSCDFQVSA